MKQLLYIITLAGMLFATTANSGSLPDHYPDGFPVAGNLDRVDLGKRLIVINDMQFYLDENATLHSLSSESDSLGRLRAGIKIGAKFSIYNGKRIATELWLLPGTYKSRSR